MVLAEFAAWQVLIVLAVALLLFGGRIPETMRNLGKGLSEFKRGMREGEEDRGGANDRAREREHEEAKKS